MLNRDAYHQFRCTPDSLWFLASFQSTLLLIPGQAFQLLLTFNLCSNARLLFQSFLDCVSSFWRNSIADRILKRFIVKPKLLFICILIGYKDFNFLKALLATHLWETFTSLKFLCESEHWSVCLLWVSLLKVLL